MPLAGFSPSCCVVLVQMEHCALTSETGTTEQVIKKKHITTHLFIDPVLGRKDTAITRQNDAGPNEKGAASRTGGSSQKPSHPYSFPARIPARLSFWCGRGLILGFHVGLLTGPNMERGYCLLN